MLLLVYTFIEGLFPLVNEAHCGYTERIAESPKLFGLSGGRVVGRSFFFRYRRRAHFFLRNDTPQILYPPVNCASCIFSSIVYFIQCWNMTASKRPSQLDH